VERRIFSTRRGWNPGPGLVGVAAQLIPRRQEQVTPISGGRSGTTPLRASGRFAVVSRWRPALQISTRSGGSRSTSSGGQPAARGSCPAVALAHQSPHVPASLPRPSAATPAQRPSRITRNSQAQVPAEQPTSRTLPGHCAVQGGQQGQSQATGASRFNSRRVRMPGAASSSTVARRQRLRRDTASRGQRSCRFCGRPGPPKSAP
jgi:hypothetical protein